MCVGFGDIDTSSRKDHLHDIETRFDRVSNSRSTGARAIRGVVRELETMGLVSTWIESRGREGRIKHIETTFDPQWVREAQAKRSEMLKRE